MTEKLQKELKKHKQKNPPGLGLEALNNQCVLKCYEQLRDSFLWY